MEEEEEEEEEEVEAEENYDWGNKSVKKPGKEHKWIGGKRGEEGILGQPEDEKTLDEGQGREELSYILLMRTKGEEKRGEEKRG